MSEGITREKFTLYLVVKWYTSTVFNNQFQNQTKLGTPLQI